jgi:hypothetical protein
MYYLIYRITNEITGKKLIGKYIGNNIKFKKTYSSNKFLLKDVKKYNIKNFRKDIIKKFEDKNSLIKSFQNMIINYTSSDDFYNYSYNLSQKGIKNIKKGMRKKSIKRLRNKYPKFNKIIKSYDKHNYLLKNYCKHGDLIISIEKFNKKYLIDNEFYCEECINEFIKKIKISEREFIDNQNKFIEIIKHAKQNEESYLKFYYPQLYISIFRWSQKYKEINFKERVYLFKNKLKNKPKCLSCDREVDFSLSKKMYKIYCNHHLNNHHTSKQEIEVFSFITKNYNKEILQNYKIDKKELDIYIPSLNLAFEFNGLYWHSDLFKEKKYHYNKWKLCKDNGIKLMTIWEDDWNFKQNIVKSIILNKIGKNKEKIYARKCIIKEVPFNKSKEFLDSNHLQGWCLSKVNLGLYYNDELVSLMTFGKRKISGKKQHELLRFCSKLNTSVIGGASKLFKHFIRNYKPNKIISYASCDISDGSLYKILGFNEIGHTGINYWWVKDKRYHRSGFMKHKLVREGADPNKTENQIMHEDGFNKIWGTGNLKYEFTI